MINSVTLNPNKMINPKANNPVQQNTVSQPVVYTKNIYPDVTLPVYGDDAIKTKPAQLSLFQMHDFHGQNIRMERAFSIINLFDKDLLFNENKFFDGNLSVDKAKVCSGDMFLGEEDKDVMVVNEFLNLAGVLADTIGNHECDMKIADFVNLVKDRKYKLLGANMHPDKESLLNSILAKSFVQEINGNKYGFIGLVPPDLAIHLKRPGDADEFHISDIDQTVKDLQKEVNDLKAQGVNKIILLSHLGYNNEKLMATRVSDIDIIAGAHTHNFIEGVTPGENLLYSPKREPVLLTQVGRDGEYVAVPNIKFNEQGQITGVQYNILKTDNFSRSLIAREQFEKILGKPEVVGRLDSVEEPPYDIYAYENPHCDFILDCLKSELNTDIAIMNSANIRGRFYDGKVDTRDLSLISPFGNKMAVVHISEDELVDRISAQIKKSMASGSHRPGILQVSGLRYEYSAGDGELQQLTYIDRNGREIPIDIKNPDKNKLYTLACDDFCIINEDCGLNLQYRYDNALQKFDIDKDKFVGDYLKKQDKPCNIKSDGRIKVTA